MVLHHVHGGGALISALHCRLEQTYLPPVQRESDTFPTALHLDVYEDKYPRVPAALVAEGKASVAAYVAAQDIDNTEIGEVLDVGDRTMSQYIFDFREGERWVVT
jgi:hypothetical protein